RALVPVLDPLAIQDVGEPRIVAPVHRDDLDARVGYNTAEPLVRWSFFALRVPRYPKLTILFAKRRDQLYPSLFGDRLGFLDPSQQDARLGLDTVNVSIETSERVANPPAFRSDVGLANIEVRGKPLLLPN